VLFAVETAGVILDKTGSRFTWLEDDPEKAGTGIPRYIPMFRGPRFEARINLAIERESKRYYQTILDNRKMNIAAFDAEVKQRREILNALEGRLARLKMRADDWQAELKEWKPKMARKTPS
jgi:hypothetical protein